MKHRYPKTPDQHGFILTALLVFIVVILIISTTSIAISISSMRGQSFFEGGLVTLAAAESGVENAILRLLRDPEYTGETLAIGGAIVEIEVLATSPTIITVTADSGAYEKTIEVRLDRVAGVLQLQRWREI